jgi:hypothetical protein
MKYYEGSAPCPGCGRTGFDSPRRAKDALCYDCHEQLAIGRAISQERNLKRNYYRLEELMTAEMTWYTIPINEIEWKLCNLLRTFSAFDREHAGGKLHQQLAGEISAVTSRYSIVLPVVTFEAAKELCEALKEACWDLKRERENYRKELDVQLATQKDEIFNQGVSRGRDLLRQLNRGEISLQEFQAIQKR